MKHLKIATCLNEAYEMKADQLYYSESKTMVISGTHNLDDGMVDFSIPMDMERQTFRYQEADNMHNEYKPKHVIGHKSPLS